MDQAKATQIVTDIFINEFEIAPEKLTPEAQLFQDLGLDSLDIVELMVALQKAFGVQLRDSDEARAIRTLGDLNAFIWNEIQKAADPAASAPRP